MTIRILESGFKVFSWICGLTLFGSVLGVIGYLVYKGAGTISIELIFGSTNPLDALLLKRPVFDGLFPAIVGTLTLVVLSVLLALPLGIATGIFMAEYAKGPVKSIFSLFYDILAGIPSIVVGIFGFSMAVWLHHHFSGKIYPCLLVSACALAFLVLPYIIRTTQVSLENLPPEIRLTALALGATKIQSICYVLLPEAIAGITGGVFLAIGRCAEDTAVIMLTGVVASAGIPGSLLGSYEALPFYIYYISSQYMDPQELATGYGAALILLGICITLLGVAGSVKGLVKKQ